MTTFSSVYGGSYLSGKELAGRTAKVRIKSIDLEKVGDPPESKLVCTFENTSKGLVLNSTNATNLSAAFGDRPEDCIGKQIELFTVPVNFNGQSFQGIRIRILDEPEPATAAPVASQGSADDSFEPPF